MRKVLRGWTPSNEKHPTLVKAIYYVGLRAIFQLSSTPLGKSLKPLISRWVVSMPYRERVSGVCFVLFLGGCGMIFGVVSIWRLKPLLGKAPWTTSSHSLGNQLEWKRYRILFNLPWFYNIFPLAGKSTWMETSSPNDLRFRFEEPSHSLGKIWLLRIVAVGIFRLPDSSGFGQPVQQALLLVYVLAGLSIFTYHIARYITCFQAASKTCSAVSFSSGKVGEIICWLPVNSVAW